MKKIIILALIAATATFSQAQIPDDTWHGPFCDNFNKGSIPSSMPDYFGLFPLTDSTAPGTPEDKNGMSVIPQYSEGQLQFTVSQARGNYEPVRLYFGKKSKGTFSGSDSLYTINLNSNSSFSFDVQNYSASELKIRVALQDINDSIINTWYTFKDKSLGDAWKYYIGRTLPASMAEPEAFESLDTEDAENIKIPTHTPSSVNISFHGGFNLRFKDQCHTQAERTQGFDFSRVKVIHLIIFSKEVSDEICFEPVAISNVKVGIDNLKLGDCEVPVGLQAIEKTSPTIITPNPAEDITTVSYISKSDATVRVFDMQGLQVMIVKGTSSAAILNTSGLNSGLYMISVEADGLAAKPEKLFVR